MIRLTCFILCICSSISATSTTSPVVSTTLGTIRGKLVYNEIADSWQYMFTGIRYAQAPVGELRFMPPVPVQPSRSVIDATQPAYVCPQREEFYTRDQMSEDCLFLNVFAPANRTNKLLPVIVNFHGGYFDTLSGNVKPLFDPQLIVRDHVVVSFNYRLGALGFLSMCNEEISGNSGLKDGVLALKTIYKIIRKFGGDPKKITLLGTAAGAAMVELLMLIDETKGLYSAAWTQSGSALSSTYIQIHPRQNALSLACELGIKYRNESDLIEQLKCKDAYEMVEATEAIIKRDPQRGYRIYNPFTPTVETDNKYAVLTRPPLELMEKGAIQDIPRVVSVNNQAGVNILPVLRAEPELINKFNEDYELLIPEDIEYTKGSDASKNLAALIKDFYFKYYDISIGTLPNYMKLITDLEHIRPSDRSVQLFSETKQSNVYMYLCAVDTKLNYLKAEENITYPGCAHVDEIGYEFITDATRPEYPNLSPVAQRILNRTLDVINDFSIDRVPVVQGTVWPPAGPERYHIVAYNYATITVYHAPYPERMAFWRSVYEDYFNSEYNLGSYFCTNDNNHSVQ